MATCAKCGAAVPEDSLFCVECGEKIDDTNADTSKVSDKPKKNKKGFFNGTKKDKSKIDDVLDAESIDLDDGLDEDLAKAAVSIGIDNAEEAEKSFDSIEDEAKNWAKSTESETPDADFTDDDLDSPPVVSVADSKIEKVADKRIIPKAVFIARNKNGAADKTFGLFIFAIIIAIIAVAFVFNTGLLNSDSVLDSAKSFSPLFLIALGGLLVARTGNIDFSLPAIAIVTYFMLMHGRTFDNFYLMLIISFAGAIGVGLFSGLFSTIGKVPSVFTGLGLLAIALTYVSIIIGSGSDFIIPIYDKFTSVYIPTAVLILSVILTFILIYLTRLGRPIYKRKGITTRDRLLYILSFVIAAIFAATAGVVGSIYSVMPVSMTNTFVFTFDYIIGMIFIIAICGSSTLFDNRVMPVLMLIIAFLAWFGIDIIISGSVFTSSPTLTALAVKLGFFLLALISDRVYTKSNLPDFYQTINVKR